MEDKLWDKTLVFALSHESLFTTLKNAERYTIIPLFDNDGVLLLFDMGNSQVGNWNIPAMP